MNGLKLGSVRGVVLAGAHQWDESAFDGTLPRPLLPVANQPLIGYVLQWLREGGIRDVTVCANSDSRLVRRCLGDGRQFGLDLSYYEDWTPRGPAGCVRDAGQMGTADLYVVADGTIIPRTSLNALLSAHNRSGALVTVAVDEGETQEQFQPVGLYVFGPDPLRHIPATGYQDIKEVLIPRLRQSGGRVEAHTIEGCCARVTGFDSYRMLNAWAVEQMVRRLTVPPGFEREGEALIHCRARVARSALLMGPILVGPGVQVSEGAVIVGPTVLGAACEVGAEAVVCRSVLWEHCELGCGSMIDQCVVAHDVRVAARARFYGQHLPIPLRSTPPARVPPVICPAQPARGALERYAAVPVAEGGAGRRAAQAAQPGSLANARSWMESVEAGRGVGVRGRNRTSNPVRSDL